MFSSWESVILLERKDLNTYGNQPHPSPHTPAFTLAHSHCLMSYSPNVWYSFPLQILCICLALWTLIFSIRFSFKYCFIIKELSLRLLSRKIQINSSSFIFLLYPYITVLRFITFNIYVFNLVIDFIPASQTNDVRATKAEMCLIC